MLANLSPSVSSMANNNILAVNGNLAQRCALLYNVSHLLNAWFVQYDRLLQTYSTCREKLSSTVPPCMQRRVPVRNNDECWSLFPSIHRKGTKRRVFLSSDARTNAASVLLMYVTRDDCNNHFPLIYSVRNYSWTVVEAENQ